MSPAPLGVNRMAGAPHAREQDVREQARLRGRPWQAAGAQPVQERPVRQPARTVPEEPAGVAGRGAQRQGGFDIDGERCEITKREAVAKQLVNKSTGADLRATKMLIDTPKDAEKKAGVTQPPEPPLFTAADEE